MFGGEDYTNRTTLVVLQDMRVRCQDWVWVLKIDNAVRFKTGLGFKRLRAFAFESGWIGKSDFVFFNSFSDDFLL